MSQRDNIRHKRLVFSLLGLCMLVVSLTFFVLGMSKPYLGIELSKGAQGWIVGAVDATGLAKSHGIIAGDKPIEINGQPAQIFLEKYNQAGAVWSLLIKELIVTDNQGQSKSVAIKGSPQPAASIMELATWFIVCVVFWIIGYYVFFRKPENKAALLLYLCGLVLGLAFSANQAEARGFTVALYIEVATSLIGPWLLVHFFLVLPEERTWLHNNPRVYLLYLPAVIMLVLFPFIGYREG